MEVFLELEQKTRTLAFTGDVKSLLSKLNMNPDTVLVVKNGELITLDAIIQNDDRIELLSVISGG